MWIRRRRVMVCPKCGQDLRERERSGILVDVCPGCKGIWLDRGELDKIIAKENRGDEDEDDEYDDDEDDEFEFGGTRGGTATRRRRGRRRGGFFQNLFDSFGGDD
jgi:Zn-finger nucleic acid-binding protein